MTSLYQAAPNARYLPFFRTEKGTQLPFLFPPFLFQIRTKKLLVSCRFAAALFDNMLHDNINQEDRHALHQHFHARTN